jgi:nicotinate (nicotinamide) nucleotide adenylyltransferase
MQFFRRAAGTPQRLAILPGTFNPPTLAHLALARAALKEADEVLFTLPRAFPHKGYEGAGFSQRAAMLETALEGEPRFSLAASAGGLFIEIAREARAAYGRGTRLTVVCGRDAAERIVNWDYGEPGAIAGMLEEFDLLVAARGGAYGPPAQVAERVRTLPLEACWEDVSATEVRRRAAAGEPWEQLVPAAIIPAVRAIYGRG